MHKSISDFILSKVLQNGLLLVDPNTGSGKTYQSCKAIYDYTHTQTEPKKIYFTTTLLKNLPEDELRKAYKNHNNPNYDKEVLVIKSNVDFVKHNIPQTKVPEKYQNEEYINLIKLIGDVSKDSFSKSPAIYREEILKRLDEAESSFRKYLRHIISTELKGNHIEKKEIIRKDKRYKWIGEIYPTVFTDEYKIYLLSVSKLLYRNDTLLKPSYPFISSDNLRNAIIFIDEFDATKETIKEHLVEKVIDTKNDYLDIIKGLHSKLHDFKPAKQFYEPYRSYAENKRNLYTLESMQKQVDSLFQKYALDYNYKTRNNDLDRTRGFLFFDGTFRSYLKNNRHYIRTVIDNDEQQVKIYFETKEEYNENKNTATDINIYSLLRDVTSFLNDFSHFIASWAEQYAKSVNNKRKQTNDIPEIFTFENAISTICDNYFKNNHLNSMLHDLITSSALRNIPKTESNISDFSFYNRGFKFFEFIDSDSHNEETKINFIQINDTPEKLLLFMAKNCKIVGLSATAKIKSVLSNYSLKYLKDELKENFIELSDEAYSRLISDHEKRYKAYYDGLVQVHIESVDKDKENKTIQERLELIAQDKDIARNFLNKLEKLSLSDSNKDYYQKRYCNIFEVLKKFVESDDIKSFLCLNMALPKTDEAKFDFNLFNLFVEQYCQIHQKEVPQITVLATSDFEPEKNRILQSLSEGKKVFVFSAYKTVGAGQNLQYEIPDTEKEKIIKLFSHGKESSQKDFDAIYLGDVTHAITNINDVQKIDLKELLHFLFDIKFLYENNEISPKDLQALVQAGFKAYSNIKDYSAPMEVVRNSYSARRKITRDVIQAVGRICRTSNKKGNVYIFTNNALLSSLETKCVKSDLMNPELKALFKFAENYISALPDKKLAIENEACRKSENANSYIKGMLQRDWTERSMQLWKDLRECVLKYPTATKEDSEQIPIIKKFYIQNVENKSVYHYAQKGDFKDIRINLFKDFSSFKKELDSEYSIMEVSEGSSRLQIFFLYSKLKDFFINQGYATEFGNKDLILSPVLFNNIYKGVLGEIAGKFILERELNTNLIEITNPEFFEFFDFELHDGIYIDFKHWKKAVVSNKDSLQKHIQEKLSKIGGKKAYIINILKQEDSVITPTQNIIEIPYLIDEEGIINPEAIKMLIGEIHNDKRF